MKKTIITGAIIALGLAGLMLWGRSNQTAGSSQISSSVEINPLSALETFYDFGTISMATGKVKHIFKIKNIGNEAVVISKVYTSCMCTTAALMIGGGQFGPYGMPGHGSIPKINQAVGQNEEVAVEVVFDPAAHGPAGVGQIQRTITIENNAGQPVELLFSALVTP